MSEETIREIFAKNLNGYLEANNKQPADIVRDLGIPFSTVSNWVNGLKLPRMGKVEMLASYFGIEKSDLLEEKKDDETGYYLNPEAAAMAQQLLDNPDLRMLFDAARDVKPENLQLAAEMLKRMKETNPDG